MAGAALKNRIENLIAMAQLLERVDANPTLVGAQQYRNLVRTVQTLLGHADIATTQVYTHVALGHLKAVHRMHHPRAKSREEGAGKREERA